MMNFTKLCIAGLIFVALGCGGKAQLSDSGSTGSGPDVAGTAPRTLNNSQVYDFLRPSCEGCHKDGATHPFFSSLAAFENLLVYNDKYVKPGAPDNSELIRLLEGNSTGPNRQMPAGGDPYSVRVQRGDGRVTMGELRLWIRNLSPRQRPPGDASVDSPLVRRKTADQVVTSLKTQLGLTDADFFPADYSDAPAERYPARSPDAAPAPPDVARANYIALGGASWMKNKKPNTQPSTVFAQQLVPMSQAWCSLAVQKPGSALLMDATLTDSSSDPAQAQRIQRNISRLHLRMLGELASADDVADLFQLFQTYEPSGTDVAWTAICAALVRHPFWVTF